MIAWLCIADIAAEAYGYKFAQKIMMISIIFLFTFIFFHHTYIKLLINHHQHVFQKLLDYFPIALLVCLGAMMSGKLIDIYATYKWKILFHVENVKFRYLVAATTDKLIFIAFAYLLGFLNIIKIPNLVEIIIIAYMIKIMINVMMINYFIKAAFLLKKLKRVSIYNRNNNFNPFKSESDKNIPTE